MSSVQVLLAALQDPRGAITSPEACRAVLLDLAAVSRFDEPKTELLRGGLDTLAAFAAADATAASLEVADVVLELLTVLVCDSHSARARIAERAALLDFPVRCVRATTSKRAGKKRNKALRAALELVEMLNYTEPSRRSAHQELLVTTLLRVLENPEEEPSLLLHTTDMLVGLMEGSSANTHAAAKFNAITILLRLLSTVSERADVKRAVCEALLVIAAVDELVPVIVANNVIRALSLCLRMRAANRHLENAALRLLARLCDQSQVFGQLVNEDMIPVLFQLLERHVHTFDVVVAVCNILEGITHFAQGCKLDLSPFVSSGLPCHGLVLVQAAIAHGHDPSLVSSVFRCFVHVLRNPAELPTLVTPRAFEGLLSLYILNCGTSGRLSEISSHVVTVVSLLSRATIESLSFQDEAQSLPALYLCLRSHMSNLRFVSQTFAIVSKYWRSTNQDRSVQSIAGFVGIAVEQLVLHSNNEGASKIQMMELYNFVREVMLTMEGIAIVLACGGHTLHRTLTQRPAFIGKPNLAPSPSLSLLMASGVDTSAMLSQVDNMSSIVVGLLANAISAEQPANSTSNGDVGASSSTRRGHRALHIGGQEYNLFVENAMRRERSSALIEADTGEDDSNCLADGYVSDNEGDDAEHVDDSDEATQAEETADCNDERGDQDDANDDGSDCDGEEDEEDGTQACVLIDRAQTSPVNSKSIVASSVDLDVNSSSPRHVRVGSPELRVVDFSKMEIKAHCYEDCEGLQFPKHPYRAQAAAASPKDDRTRSRQSKVLPTDSILIDHPPLQPEPCRPPDANSMALFVEHATRRREQFLATDSQTRARLVYENTSTFESNRPGSCSAPICYSSIGSIDAYDISDHSKAFIHSPSLTFDSCFESGNLERAIQIGECEYDLVLRRDVNTSGHMQWFYFAISNLTAQVRSRGTKFRFNIINLCKPDSLFNQGMQPVIYSVKDAETRHIGWRRSGEDVYYYPNPFSRSTKPTHIQAKGVPNTVNDENNNEHIAAPRGDMTTSSRTSGTNQSSGATYFTLTFTLEFENADDTYLIAHSYPYTFSDHQRYLEKILRLQRASRRAPQIVKHSVLCTTLSGRPCDLLTISDFSVSTTELKARRSIVLTSRVHPGEAQASWIMQGVLDFLVSSSEIARVLRRLFVFYVVPMLNPDGVFYGNSRCSLSACDLNRHWHQPSESLHPTIFHTKELIRQQHAARGLVFFCDIHGHSRKKNVFMYGCDTKKRPNPLARIFARLFSSQLTAKRFVSFPDCSFKVGKDKETTARVVLANELRLSWCFTLEASFCGASFGDLQGTHFTAKHMQLVGSSLCETLLSACISDSSLRDRLVSIVDDYTVSLAAYAESHLRESGIVSDPSRVADAVPKSTPRKGKTASSIVPSKPPTSKGGSQVRRRRSSPQMDDDKKSSATKATRRAVTKRGSLPIRRRSSTLSEYPVTKATSREATLDQAIDPAGPTKKSLSKRRSLKLVADMNAVAKLEPMMDLLGTFDPPDEEDTQLSKLQKFVRASSSGNSSSTSSTIGSLPVTPELPTPGVALPKHTVRHGGIASTLADAATFGFSARDAVPVVLPPPVSELLHARSPKPPSKGVRFKGAGRQYAAVSPAKAPAIAELATTSTKASAVGYEPDLINASAIALRQRALDSTPASATRTAKLLGTAPTSTASSAGGTFNFPAVI